jgi:hypothetical protein
MLNYRFCSICWAVGLSLFLPSWSMGQTIRAGVAKVDITKLEAGPVNDPLFAKALVIESGDTTVVLVSVDAVAIGQIGPIKNDYLPTVRTRMEQELGIPANRLVVNASHCHGIVCDDVADRTVAAIALAKSRMTPVRIGSGIGSEDRIMENRRLKMKDGKEIDVRHAYALPPDDQVAGIGTVDPKIGVVRIDRLDGSPLAVRYRLQRLYPCLHPAIAPHLPLVLSLHGDGAGRSFQLNPEGTAFVAETDAAAAQLEGQPWRGRRRSGDTTIDLRLG